MNKKVAIIVAILLTIVMILLILLIFTGGKIPSPFRQTPQPTPVGQSGSFQMMSIQPPQDATGEKKYAPLKLIYVTFNKQINPNTIDVTVEPNHEVKAEVSESGNQLIISPANPPFWTPDTLYTITIHRGLSATDGSMLNTDIQYKIKTVLPTEEGNPHI